MKFRHFAIKIAVVRFIVKKYVFFIAAVFLSSLLTSCFAFQSKESEDKAITVCFSYSGRDSEPYSSNEESIHNAFSDRNKYCFFEHNANCSLKDQIDGILSFIEKKADYIIIDPVNEHGLEHAIENCYEMNIPVILCGGSVFLEPGHENRIAYEIRPDYYRQAVSAIKCLDVYKKGKVDVGICVLNDFSDSISARERNKALGEALEKHEGWKILSKRETKGEYLTAKRIMEENYYAFNKIDAVFVESENDYQGVIDVLFKHGKMPGEDIYVFAFEDSENLRKMIISGVLNFTVMNKHNSGQDIEHIIGRIEGRRSYKKYSIIEGNGIYSSKAIEESVEKENKSILSKILD